MEFVALNDGNLAAAVKIHLENLREGILYELGEEMTELFYREVVGDEDSWGTVAVEDSKPAGIAVCTLNPMELTEKTYSKNKVKIAKAAVRKATRKPGIINHLLEAKLHSIDPEPTLLF
ncbi:MAG: hypothetical protein ABH834_04740, partial [Candidatus Altiarchaeota archaeon]